MLLLDLINLVFDHVSISTFLLDFLIFGQKLLFQLLVVLGFSLLCVAALDDVTAGSLELWSGLILLLGLLKVCELFLHLGLLLLGGR